MNLTVTISKEDMQRIQRRAAKIENDLRSEHAPVLQYLFHYVAEPYVESVLSGMGTIDVGKVWQEGGIVTQNLSSFMGSTPTVRWRTLHPYTVERKREQGLSLTMWLKTGRTKASLKPVLKAYKHTFDIYAGIRPSDDPVAYRRAIATEYGGESDFGNPYEGRALFTLLNEVFIQNIPAIRDGVRKALAETIENSGWGR